MLIYTPHITNRITYVLQHVFGKCYGLPYIITNNISEYNAFTQPKLTYATTKVAETQLYAIGLLSESTITAQYPSIVTYKGVNCPFATSNGIMPFDVFSAIFYLITRYEEYLPYIPNKYGQYQAKDSFAYQNNFLHLPVIDSWLEDLKNILHVQYPSLKFAKRKTILQHSYDIDIAFAYKHKPWYINIGAFAKDIIQANWYACNKRIAVLRNKEKDPYDTFEIIHEQHQKCATIPLYFILVGNRNTYNKNTNYRNKTFTKIIKALCLQGIVGLHPSYYTPNNANLLSTEYERLTNIIKQPIDKSRQHYLRQVLPHTFVQNIHQGLLHEYSMGYAELPGFRASTCTPFLFYNLATEQVTPLTIYPITYMENTFADDMQLTPEAAQLQMEALYHTVAKYNGYFCSIWHNHSLSNVGVWQGWLAVHNHMLALTSTCNNG